MTPQPTYDLDDTLQNFVKERDRSAFKTGIFTVGLLLLAGLTGVGVWAVYHLLNPFLTPIYWAVLIGTVLFPLKQIITNAVRGWLRGLREENKPLVIGIVSLPFNGLNNLSEQMWAVITSNQIYYLIGGYAAMKVLTYEGTFLALIGIVADIYGMLDNIIVFFSGKWIIPIFVLYFIAFSGWAYTQQQDWKHMKLARILSIPIWFIGLVYFSSFCGPFGVPVLLAMSAFIALIALQILQSGETDEEENGSKPAVDERAVDAAADSSGDAAQFHDTQPMIPSPVQRSTSAKHQSSTADSSSSEADEKPVTENEHPGDTYLRGIFGACVLLWTVRHTWLLSLLAIPLMYTLAKKLGQKLGLFDAISNATSPMLTSVKEKGNRITTLVIPITIKKFFKSIFSADQSLKEGLEGSMDLVSSVLVMLLMLIFGLFATFFVIFQVHSEVSHLATVVTKVVTAEEGGAAGVIGTAVNFTGAQLSEHDIEGYVEDAYQQGRTWLAQQVRGLADAKDTERADMLEAQVKMVVDKLWELYQESTSVVMAHQDSYEVVKGDWFTQMKASMDVSKLTSELTRIAQENIATLQSIGTSVWGVVSSNMSLLTGILGSILGIILGFGMELLNFIIELIVFMTVVYYLLASSTTQWKPLEWFSQMSGGKVKSGKVGRVSGGVSRAVEEAISGVFLLSGKMAIFYGLYTWFIHSMFALNIVFIPSMLAALFAAVPLTSPCAVCVLGCVELWLVKGEGAAALLFALANFAPLMFADAAFYLEVKGSHPYVTGLAIVGGMYWLGFKGAIIGPIILCSMLVLVKLLAAIRQQ